MEIEKELQKFDMPTTVIEKMAEQYLPLKIKDLADKEGYKAVREARLTVKEKRVFVEKRRKELKEDSLRFGKAVDAEARRITALLEPIESHLEAQEGWWDTEKERLKQEAIKQEQEKLQARVDALRQYNCSIPVAALQVMDDTDFDWTLESVKAEYEIAEKARIAAEKEKQEAERLELERLAAIKAEQEAERLRLEEIARVQAEKEAAIKAEQEAERLRLEEIARVQAEKEAAIKAEQDRLAAEKKAIEDMESVRLRKIEEEKLAVERERIRLTELETARVAAVEAERIRIEHEAEEQRLEEERQKALLPETEKLTAWILEIRRVSLTVPTLTDATLREAAYVALDRINEGIDHVIRITG